MRQNKYHSLGPGKNKDKSQSRMGAYCISKGGKIIYHRATFKRLACSPDSQKILFGLIDVIKTDIIRSNCRVSAIKRVTSPCLFTGARVFFFYLRAFVLYTESVFFILFLFCSSLVGFSLFSNYGIGGVG